MRFLYHIIIISSFFAGIQDALGRTIERPAYREYKEPLISDESFSELESYGESIAAIMMLMHGECCPQDLKKALTYCLQCLQDFDVEEEAKDGVCYPEKHTLTVLAARLYMEAGDFNAAKRMLDNEKNKGTDMLVLEGDIAIREGRLDEARKKYEKAYDADSSNLQAARRLSDISLSGLETSTGVPRYAHDFIWLRAMRRSSIKWKKAVEEFSTKKPTHIFRFYPFALEAAHAGIPSAMVYLHKVYMNGCGFIKRDVARAEYWLWNAEHLSK